MKGGMKRIVIQKRPRTGNAPDDRKDYPDCESPQESWRRCPPARPITPLAFFRHGGIYRSDVIHKPSRPEGGCRLPLVGPEPQSKDATGGTTRPISSSAMSSGRLFLDRV